jgi:hypothetical protein
MPIPPGKPRLAAAATMSKASRRQDQCAPAPQETDLERPANTRKDTTMVNHIKDEQQKIPAAYRELPSDSVSTLLPMLIGGLVLIVIAMIVIMVFA